MRLLAFILLLSACEMPKELPKNTTSPESCKSLKSIWESTSDNEQHDLRAFPFTFQFVPYSYIAPDSSICNQQAKWYMITPPTNGASFVMNFQSGCNAWGFTVYIRTHCDSIEFCNNDFSVCKTFN